MTLTLCVKMRIMNVSYFKIRVHKAHRIIKYGWIYFKYEHRNLYILVNYNYLQQKIIIYKVYYSDNKITQRRINIYIHVNIKIVFRFKNTLNRTTNNNIYFLVKRLFINNSFCEQVGSKRLTIIAFSYRQ